MQRIGVFVCHCGSNIAATVDVAAVAEAAKSQPGVVFATDYTYMCSENGQNLIADSIKEYGLTAVVVCSCSPRMHEATFRKVAELRLPTSVNSVHGSTRIQRSVLRRRSA